MTQVETLKDAALSKDVAASAGSVQAGSDLYSKMKQLQRQLEFLDIQEEYIKDEMQNLKRELVRAKVRGRALGAAANLLTGLLVWKKEHHHSQLP